MDARLSAAAREFNAGRFFEAHEALEEALDELPDGLWELFLGLIQIAVGYHKLANGHAGAMRMLGLGLEKIAGHPDDAAGLDLASLRERVRADRDALLGSTFDADAFRASPPRLLPDSGQPVAEALSRVGFREIRDELFSGRLTSIRK